MCVLVDVENFCKWVDKVCCDVENYGGFKLVCDMLLVYDNMKCVIELIIDEQKESVFGVIIGIELIMCELLNVFKKYGLEMICFEVGDKFDLNQYEVMFEVLVFGIKVGEIIQVLVEGFMFYDCLLCLVQVGVSLNVG